MKIARKRHNNDVIWSR